MFPKDLADEIVVILLCCKGKHPSYLCFAAPYTSRESVERAISGAAGRLNDRRFPKFSSVKPNNARHSLVAIQQLSQSLQFSGARFLRLLLMEFQDIGAREKRPVEAARLYQKKAGEASQA